MRLQNKVAVVTGAASGMGKQIALLFAKEGAKVTVSDLHLDGAKDTVREIEADGGTAFAIKTNVAEEADIQTLIDTTVTTYSTVDILVNNAGIMDNMAAAGAIDDQMWERVFAVNTTGVMRATRKVIPIFLEKGQGSIVNIASAGGLFGARAGATYTASKHAVVGFTKNTAYMYAQKGIRCNAIAPGGVETNIGASMTGINEFGMSRQGTGMSTNPRNGKPEEVANVALFLASDEASFVNGAIVTADGGWTSY
jgi:NAD(P)-dependent dehydrogenase (short-subunit alcohol dehydrogenase family)